MVVHVNLNFRCLYFLLWLFNWLLSCFQWLHVHCFDLLLSNWEFICFQCLHFSWCLQLNVSLFPDFQLLLGLKCQLNLPFTSLSLSLQLHSVLMLKLTCQQCLQLNYNFFSTSISTAISISFTNCILTASSLFHNILNSWKHNFCLSSFVS